MPIFSINQKAPVQTEQVLFCYLFGIEELLVTS